MCNTIDCNIFEVGLSAALSLGTRGCYKLLFSNKLPLLFGMIINRNYLTFELTFAHFRGLVRDALIEL